MKLIEGFECSGCAACCDACARDAITLSVDAEGFLYPKVDSTKCVECGRCVQVCPSSSPDLPRQPLAVYAAKAKDEELRLESSSGGAFSLLARQILSKGGKVYGAAFDRSDWSVRHIGVENEGGLGELRGSKYLQSRVIGVYRNVKADLMSGFPVLFSGTPCQIAALRHYLGRSYDSLILVDVVCHGVPSPLVWKNYLKFRTTALAGGRGSASAEGRDIRRIAFRHKNCGWKRYSMSLRFANDMEYRSAFSEDPFMRAFLAELCNRPSCHNCNFRELRSGSDLTIGDFWGIEKFHPEVDDDCGTSLVLVNTDKGKSLWNYVVSGLDVMPATFDEAIAGNSALVRSPHPHRNRELFLKKCSAKRFDSLVVKMLRPCFVSRARTFVGRVLRRMGRRK